MMLTDATARLRRTAAAIRARQVLAPDDADFLAWGIETALDGEASLD
jgi:hypothetical protein